MALRIADVVEALRKQLEDNAANFIRSFVPERSYADWELKLEDADQLHVDLALNSTEITTALDTVSNLHYLLPIEICIRLRFGDSETNPSDGRISLKEIDDLIELESQINEFLTADRLTDFDDAVWMETNIRAAYIPRHLREMRQFTGIVRTTYKVHRALA